MAFSAGEIIATLKLDRTQFNLDLDRAVADADAKTKDGVSLPVKPELDQRAMDEVLLEEEPLRADIEPEVKPKYAKSEAEAVGKSLASDILTGAESGSGVGGASGKGGIGSLISAMLGQGLTEAEVVSGLRNLKFSGSEIKSALAAALLRDIGTSGSGSEPIAAAIVRSLMPTSQEMDTAFRQATQGIWQGPVREISGSLESTLSSGQDGGGGELLALEMAKSLLPTGPQMDAAFQKDTPSLVSAAEQIAQKIQSAVEGAFAGGGASSGGGLGGLSSTLSDAGSSLLSAGGFGGTGISAILFNPASISAAVAAAGGAGLAIGGALAASVIGGAGTLVALLPGFLDLQKGLAAYTAISTGASTKGMTPGQIGLGKGLQGLIGSGSKGLGAAEAQIMPQITKFINAVTKALPLMNEFAKPAIAAMSGFFGAIDKGLGSGGFKSFVGDMSKLVGPIMTEFGQVILNLGGALGGFLKLFGGVGASRIGPWFVKITGELSHFLNHVKLGHGFVAGMITVFSNLGKILGTVFTAMKILGGALAPIGLQIFRIAGWMAEWVTRILKMIPPPVVTAIAALGILLGVVGGTLLLAGIAITGFTAGVYFLNVALGFLEVIAGSVLVPIGLIVLGVAAVGFATYELFNHWRTVWGYIKMAALEAWRFLYNDILKPLVDFFGSILSGGITLFGKLWGSVWSGIQDAVTTVWKVIKPIFDLIKTAIGDVVSGIGKVTGIAGKIGGGVIGGIGKAVSGIGNFFSKPFGLASGGPTQANKIQLVGEQGPELFVPSTSGTIVPNGRFGQSHQIVFQIDARGHSNPQQIVSAVHSAISATLPSLQAALARGAA